MLSCLLSSCFLLVLFFIFSYLPQGLHSVGSCALVVVVIGRHLITAHVGDCRAVVTGALRLSRVNEKEKEKEEFKRTGAMTLTEDHTCLNQKEVACIQQRSTDPYPVCAFLFCFFFPILVAFRLLSPED